MFPVLGEGLVLGIPKGCKAFFLSLFDLGVVCVAACSDNTARFFYAHAMERGWEGYQAVRVDRKSMPKLLCKAAAALAKLNSFNRLSGPLSLLHLFAFLP